MASERPGSRPDDTGGRSHDGAVASYAHTAPSTITRPLLTQAELAQLVADAVQQVRGVVRLEPTLQTVMLTRLGQTTASGRFRFGAAQQGLARFGDSVVGVRVSLHELAADVRVDIAVDTSRRAADTAAAVEQAVVDTLHAHDHLAGPITVTVLAIEAQSGT